MVEHINSLVGVNTLLQQGAFALDVTSSSKFLCTINHHVGGDGTRLGGVCHFGVDRADVCVLGNVSPFCLRV